MTVLRMSVAWCRPKATNTHSEYVILIAFLMKPWLNDSDSALMYTYSVRLFF
jgi:hypothetical protein